MMKVIFSIAVLSMVCAARVFSMDIMTEHKMKSVIIQIASNTVDPTKDPKVKDTDVVKTPDIPQGLTPKY